MPLYLRNVGSETHLGQLSEDFHQEIRKLNIKIKGVLSQQVQECSLSALNYQGLVRVWKGLSDSHISLFRTWCISSQCTGCLELLENSATEDLMPSFGIHKYCIYMINTQKNVYVCVRAHMHTHTEFLKIIA